MTASLLSPEESTNSAVGHQFTAMGAFIKMYCRYGLGSCHEDSRQAFSDTAKGYLRMDRSLEAHRALSSYPLRSGSLRLGTGCCSLPGGNRQQGGEVDEGTRGLPGLCVERANTYLVGPIKLKLTSESTDSGMQTLQPHCLSLTHPSAL